MPVDLAEDTLDLMIELLEAGAPTPQSYPFPSLGRTGHQEQRIFRVAVLENPFLRAIIVPDLGGRILRLEHKGAKTDAWPFSDGLALIEEGRRGVVCPIGLQVRTKFEDRLNAMGYVASQPDFTEDAEEPAGLWWGELCGDGLSLNVRYSLPADEACLEIEVRAFNRTLRPLPYNGGLGLRSEWTRTEEGWLSANGLLVQSADLAYGEPDGIYRFNRLRCLAPRQLDAWTARIYPYPGLQTLRNANSRVAVGWDGRNLSVLSSTEIPGGKVVIRTVKDATLELPIDLHPSAPTTISLESVPDPIVELVLLDNRKTELIRAETTVADRVLPAARAKDEPSPELIDPQNLPEETFSISNRHLAHLLLGYRSLGQGDFAEAARSFEQSLLFNAEDHLTWWIKAVAERLAGNVDEERPELLNAHFLAPLEPALRAESYLSSPSHAKEKSAVLTPLEATPEVFVEVACLLIEANLLEESAKWIDESLRHDDLPMLRYLLAYAYLKGSRMDVQAAEQVQLAVRPEPAPPYASRPIEREALLKLTERFPADSSLRRLLTLSTQTAIDPS